jgi:hypothetical protein
MYESLRLLSYVIAETIVRTLSTVSRWITIDTGYRNQSAVANGEIDRVVILIVNVSARYIEKETVLYVF